MSLPPINHLLFIPAMLAFGFAIGWLLGTRNVRQEWQRAEKRRKKAEDNG